MPDLRHSIVMDAPPERVHPLVAYGAGLAKWWAEDVTEDGPGGAVELGFFNRATVYRLRPVLSTSPALAEWVCESGKEWAGTRLTFELTASRGQALLRFAHAGWQQNSDYFVSCNTTWGGLMFRLKAAAEGKNPGPLFSRSGMGY
jgi:uncharacterized protein YndB with AHSA1/START domain